MGIVALRPQAHRLLHYSNILLFAQIRVWPPLHKAPQEIRTFLGSRNVVPHEISVANDAKDFGAQPRLSDLSISGMIKWPLWAERLFFRLRFLRPTLQG